ncbi:MAG: FAD-dependent oxidoreductase [Stellaceae bacterium]
MGPARQRRRIQRAGNGQLSASVIACPCPSPLPLSPQAGRGRGSRGRREALRGGAIRQQLTPLAASSWRAHPFARGSHSYGRPGHAGDRAVLAAPVADRIFFAGEATSANFFSPVHGAYETGICPAEEALASLG